MVLMKTIIVMPAYNASKTLEKTFKDIPMKYVDDIILVDDYSIDNTAEISKKLGIKTICHKVNKGYGGNQKTCYREALKMGADIIVMLHPDYQYDPKKIPEMIKPIKEGKADIVYGSRMLPKDGAKEGGMPLYKRIGNKLLTFIFNLMLGTNLTDVPTGYIAYSRKVLETIPFLRSLDGFTFDEEVIIQCVDKKFRMTEIPIPTRYEKDSSSISFKKSVKYGSSLSLSLIKYKLHQIGLIRFKLVD
jgi:glycosyltransferase involved in cell wall biosynthesis